MSDLGRNDALIGELRAEWLRLFEAIERARAAGRADVSAATVSWEVLKESVSLRQGDALEENKLRALKEQCVRMREDLLQQDRHER